MELYEKLCEVYEQVFPINSKTVDFIESFTNKDSQIIDVACGTGDHVAELASRGYKIKGLDLSSMMIDRAKEKHPTLSFTELNMLDVSKFQQEKVGTLYCLGNSLVHLKDVDEVNSFFKDSFELLEDQGALIVQIVNYNRVIKDNVKSLPTITNGDIEFIRNYEISDDSRHVSFNTELTVGADTFESSVDLLTLQKEELQLMLKLIGFEEIQFYGAYDKTEWSEDSFPTIFVAKKGKL